MAKARFVQIGVLLVAVALTAFFVYSSPYFRIQDISVGGTVKVPPADVISVSGLYRGMHMLPLNLATVEASVRTLPWVKTARAAQALPGKVFITITERKPLALVPSTRGFYLIDEEGRALDIVTSGRITYPIITGFDPGEAVAGDFLNATEVMAGIRCIGSLTPAIAERFSEVNAGPEGEVVVFLTGGVRLYLGQADAQLRKKFLVAESVLEDLRKSRSEVEYIDLRYGNPIIKPRDTRVVPPPPGRQAPATKSTTGR
jgi:cell division protein FtsQ